MYLEKSIKTDTAILVLFDEQSLADKLNEDCDWWTGDDDLDMEEHAKNLAYIETRFDGHFQVVVTDDPSRVTGKLLKQTQLDIPSGNLFFGGGESLPGEGYFDYDGLGSLCIEQGSTYVTTFDTEIGYTFLLSNERISQSCQGHFEEEQIGDSVAANTIADFLNTSISELDQLMDIVGGDWSTTSDDEKVWARCSAAGIELMYLANKLTYIHLFSDGIKSGGLEYRKYHGELPEGLSFGDLQTDVTEKFGRPEKGTGKFWGIYRFQDYGLRVGYANGELCEVNILSLDSELMH